MAGLLGFEAVRGASAKLGVSSKDHNCHSRCLYANHPAAQDFECNGLWLLKNSIARPLAEKRSGRMLYKRRSRNRDAFAIIGTAKN